MYNGITNDEGERIAKFIDEVSKLNIPCVSGRSEQVAVNCTYCGRRYADTMCGIHPAKCKNN